MGGGDNFEQSVRTDFKKKVMVEQMLGGRSHANIWGRSVHAERRISVKNLRQEPVMSGGEVRPGR